MATCWNANDRLQAVLSVLRDLLGVEADSTAFYLVWALGILTLATGSIAFAVKVSTNRTIDSMRLLYNAMEMASRLDFDHPIVTYQKDEFGEVVVSGEGGLPPRDITKQVAQLFGVPINQLFADTDPMPIINNAIEKLKENNSTQQ